MEHDFKICEILSKVYKSKKDAQKKKNLNTERLQRFPPSQGYSFIHSFIHQAYTLREFIKCPVPYEALSCETSFSSPNFCKNMY